MTRKRTSTNGQKPRPTLDEVLAGEGNRLVAVNFGYNGGHYIAPPPHLASRGGVWLHPLDPVELPIYLWRPYPIESLRDMYENFTYIEMFKTNELPRHRHKPSRDRDDLPVPCRVLTENNIKAIYERMDEPLDESLRRTIEIDVKVDVNFTERQHAEWLRTYKIPMLLLMRHFEQGWRNRSDVIRLIESTIKKHSKQLDEYAKMSESWRALLEREGERK